MRKSLALVIGVVSIAATLHAQTPPAFEVASIRPNTSGNAQGQGLAGPRPGGRFIAVGATLRGLVSGAWDGLQVVGGPDWIDRSRFDIDARAGGDVPPDDMRQMLRSLLADRFSLVVHTEAREVPVFVLATARGDRRLGPNIRESDAACAKEARSFTPSGRGGPAPACGDFRMGARSLVARGMFMPAFAELMGGRTGRPVIDGTGLDAAYDLELEWSSDLGLQQAPPGAAGAAELTPEGLSLFTALQEQLGLRLQAARGPVDVVVIDRAEMPTEN
jgi:uncharacterized protein (TIGR03435 family)